MLTMATMVPQAEPNRAGISMVTGWAIAERSPRRPHPHRPHRHPIATEISTASNRVICSPHALSHPPHHRPVHHRSPLLHLRPDPPHVAYRVTGIYRHHAPHR